MGDMCVNRILYIVCMVNYIYPFSSLKQHSKPRKIRSGISLHIMNLNGFESWFSECGILKRAWE